MKCDKEKSVSKFNVVDGEDVEKALATGRQISITRGDNGKVLRKQNPLQRRLQLVKMQIQLKVEALLWNATGGKGFTIVSPKRLLGLRFLHLRLTEESETAEL